MNLYQILRFCVQWTIQLVLWCGRCKMEQAQEIRYIFYYIYFKYFSELLQSYYKHWTHKWMTFSLLNYPRSHEYVCLHICMRVSKLSSIPCPASKWNHKEIFSPKCVCVYMNVSVCMIVYVYASVLKVGENILVLQTDWLDY